MNPLSLLKYLRNPIVLAIVLGVLVVVSFMVDAKVNNRDRDRADYLKLFGSVIATSLATHFYLKSKPTSQYGGSSHAPAPVHAHYDPTPQPQTTSLYSSSDVFADTPNF